MGEKKGVKAKNKTNAKLIMRNSIKNNGGGVEGARGGMERWIRYA